MKNSDSGSGRPAVTEVISRGAERMNMIRKQDLKELLEERGRCVSIYMPAHCITMEAAQEPVD